MSLYGAMMTGVAGLNANSQALSVASSNIANVNTVGYKTATTQFSTLLASAGNGDPSSASVIANAKANVAAQGLPISTNSATDLAISGNGFFVVSTTPSAAGGFAYTRAGNFTADASGNLKNSAGFYLMGWALDTAGNPPTNPNQLNTINVSNLSGKAVATANVSISANLQASATTVSTYNRTTNNMYSGAVMPDFQRTVNIVDSQGGTQPLEYSFVKTGANSWAYEVSYKGAVANIGGAGSNPIATGTMIFNADGSLNSITSTDGSSQTGVPPGSARISIPWSASSGLSAQSILVNMGTPGHTSGITQYDTTSTLNSSTVDGAVYGNVTSLSIGADGLVSANFSNGLSQAVFKVPLATFSNPDGLAGISGNAYTATTDSGLVVINAAQTGGAGSLNQKQLEGSTVDLATEFTNLITAQRAYSASSKIVTTSSEMLDQLLQIMR
jgi:flagellar hook protein FlgE